MLEGILEETVSRVQRRSNARTELQNTFVRLDNFINNLNDKINSRIQLVEQVFLQNYKTQVKQMMEELKALRAVLDEQLLKERANERLFFLEEERDFFREQVIKLNEQLNNMNKTNLKLKSSLEEAKIEAANYKGLVAGLQRKIQKIKNEALETERLKPMRSTVFTTQAEHKDTISTFPSKPAITITRNFGFSQSLKELPKYKSVELKRDKIDNVPDSQLLKKQQILQECIKDVKKKIFYRTLNQQNNAKMHFDQDKKVTFEKFTRSDKEDLIRSILVNSNLLEQFYAFMTQPKGLAGSISSKFAQTKDNRASFNQKIFKIKLLGGGPHHSK